MSFLFNSVSSEYFDLFISLKRVAKLYCDTEEMAKNNINYNKNVELIIEKLTKQLKEYKEMLDFYFDSETRLFNVFLHEGAMWECKTFEDYIIYLENCDTDELKLYFFSDLTKIDIEDENLQNSIKDYDSTLSIIKKLSISPKSKWNAFSFIQDLDDNRRKFIEFLKIYYPIFKQLYIENSDEITSYHNSIINKANNEGSSFIQNLLGSSFKLENFKDIRIWTSYFLLGVNLSSNNDELNLFVGIDYEEIMKKLKGSNDVEQCLIAFKNLSDKTRFEILKLLLQEEHYGQQISDKLGITTATVSYHINFLTSVELISVERRDHRIYYVLNKEPLQKLVYFLNDEFKLNLNL